MNQIFQDIFGISPKDQWTKVRSDKSIAIELIENTNDAGGQAIFIQAPFKAPYIGPYFPMFEEACRKLLPFENRSVCLWKDVEAKKHPAYMLVTHKHFTDREIYFLANTSHSANYSAVSVTLNVVPEKIERWDTLTGEIKKYECYSIENGKPLLTLDYPPCQSDVFVVYPATDPQAIADRANPLEHFRFKAPPIESLPFGNEWQCQLNNPNGAMLYQKWQSSYNVEAQHKWTYCRIITFTHKFVATDVDAIKPVKVVIDGLVGDYGWCKGTIDMPIGGDRAHFTWPSGLEIHVNDKPVQVQFNFSPVYLDAYWPVVDISKYLVEGENEIKLVCTTHGHSTFHVVTDPWQIIGNFEVDESDGIPKLQKARTTVQLGDLNTQGFMRYHGGFSYLQDLVVPADFDGKRFKLHIADTTDCVEVKINGEPCGLCWSKWDLDVTALIKPGKSNSFELIYYGIAQNMPPNKCIPPRFARPNYFRCF